MIEIIVAFILGLISIGANVFRTVSVADGKPFHVIWSSVVVGVAYYFGINYIVKGAVPNYIAYSAGAAIITVYMAWKRGNKSEEL